jgi:hypothetical protein
MIEWIASPQSLCSCDFCVATRDGEVFAEIRHEFFSECGCICRAGERLEVCRNSFLSGRWFLRRENHILCEARKTSARDYRLEIWSHRNRWQLTPRRLLSRTYQVQQGDHEAGIIMPVHPWTRRRRILIEPAETPEDRAEVEDPVLFGFWLISMLWQVNRVAMPAESGGPAPAGLAEPS